MIKELVKSAGHYLKVLPLLSKFKLWRYIFLSGFLSLLLGGSLIAFAYGLSDNIGSLLFDWYPFEFGSSVIKSISDFVGGALLIFGFLFLYKYIVLIVLSPILGIISEKMEDNLSSSPVAKADFSFGNMISSIIRGIRISLRNITRELLLTLLIFPTGFIPGLNVLTVPALFMLQAYYAGFGNMDFYMERHLNMSRSVSFVKDHKGMAYGNGALFLLLLLIPGLGLILAPTLGCITAAYSVHPYFDQNPEVPDFV